MPYPIEVDKKPSTKFVLANNTLQSSLANRESLFEGREPKAVAREFLSSSPDSEFAAILDCYPPPFDEYNQRVDPFYRTLEGYISDIYGKRRDLRILRMLLLSHRAQIQIGKVISYPEAETEDVVSTHILNYREELVFAPTIHLDYTQAQAHIHFWTLGQFGQEQTGAWKLFPLPPKILYVLAGIVSVEGDATRWSYGRGSYPIFLKDNIAKTPISQI